MHSSVCVSPQLFCFGGMVCYQQQQQQWQWHLAIVNDNQMKKSSLPAGAGTNSECSTVVRGKYEAGPRLKSWDLEIWQQSQASWGSEW